MKKLLLILTLILCINQSYVFGQEQVVIQMSDDSLIVKNVWDIQRIYFREDPNKLTYQTPEAVDLGLPSGLKWASTNLTADAEDAVNLYGWGDITGKNHSANLSYFPKKDIIKDIVTSSYDIVFHALEGEWRLPSAEDWAELLDNTEASIDATSQSVILTSKLNGNSITLPISGYREKEDILSSTSGYYWTGILSQDTNKAILYRFDIADSNVSIVKDSLQRYMGCSIRPVYGAYTKNIAITSNISSVSKNTISLSIAFDGDISDYSTYRLVVSKDESFTSPATYSYTLPTEGSATVSLSGLDYNTTYYIYASITSQDGSEIHSNTVSAQTETKYSVTFVDLGLKSGLKWANVNFGVEGNDSTQYGNYFAWADPYETSVNQSTYTILVESSPSNIAGTQYDVVTKILGGDAHIPNTYDFMELMNSCTWKYVYSPVEGCLVTGPNGNSIFMPFAGNRQYNGSKYDVSYAAYYWTSDNYSSANATYYTFNSQRVGRAKDAQKYLGMSIRPVSGVSNTKDPTTGDDDDEPSNPSDYDTAAVDLGLSVLWASYNVGASSANDLGDKYAWGETETKDSYTSGNYVANCDTANISGTVYDVAHVKWGGDWRMPTELELNELMSECTWSWNSSNNTYTVTGTNGNSIIFPVDSYKTASYWSSTLYTLDDVFYRKMVYYMNLDQGRIPDYCEYYYKYLGRYIRPVKNK